MARRGLRRRRRTPVLHVRAEDFAGCEWPVEHGFLYRLPVEEGWFNARQYMTLTFGDVFKSQTPDQAWSQFKLWEFFDKTPPESVKCAAMRLMRKKRAGLLRRRRQGRTYIYRVNNDKGWLEVESNFYRKNKSPYRRIRVKRRSEVSIEDY